MTTQLRLGEPEGRPLILDATPRPGRSFIRDLDAAKLAQARAKVLRLMLDEKWHTIEELRREGGSSGDRRARQLRDVEFGGFVVETKRASQIDPHDIPAATGLHGYVAKAQWPMVWLWRIVPGSVTPEKIQRFLEAHRKEAK